MCRVVVFFTSVDLFGKDGRPLQVDLEEEGGDGEDVNGDNEDD